jgi:hypothetical protein
MELVRRRVGRPSGHVFSREDGDRMLTRIALLADVQVTLEEKLFVLAHECEEDRFTRNYLMANHVRQCIYCPEVRYVMVPQNWKAHLRSGRHLSRERDYITSTSALPLLFLCSPQCHIIHFVYLHVLMMSRTTQSSCQ